MTNFYTSTRNNNLVSSFSNAVLQGISEHGGLFVPKNLNESKIDLNALLNLNYQEMALLILRIFADDFSQEELKKCINLAYTSTFDTDEVVKVNPLNNASLLELYHGPTSAFKDVALQILPLFMLTSKKIQNNTNDFFILTATSGDTGKAALEGFKNHIGIKVICLYPNQLVSQMQEKQMLSTNGNNTYTYAVKGNFDDCQRMVKEVFNDIKFNDICKESHIQLSSANSINIGRLCPQIIYYFYSYIQLVKNKTIEMNDTINFVVPTGNFGNILAGYYAKLLGLPINKLICASNQNNVLTDFINKGIYNRNREFYKTISPSMDILISSNVERFLFECCDHDSNRVNELMFDLQTTGIYELNKTELEKVRKDFIAYSSNDDSTKKAIKKILKDCNRIVDTHTAVAIDCYQQYLNDTNDQTHTVILSTASCFKFAHDVVNALIEDSHHNEEEAIKFIQNYSSEKLPKPLEELLSLPTIFPKIIRQDDLRNIITERMKK